MVTRDREASRRKEELESNNKSSKSKPGFGRTFKNLRVLLVIHLYIGKKCYGTEGGNRGFNRSYSDRPGEALGLFFSLGQLGI